MRTLTILLLLLQGALLIFGSDDCRNYGPLLTLKSSGLGPANVGCFHENRVRRLGSKWSSEICESCECSSDGVKCCLYVSKPVLFPDDCKLVLDTEQCKYNLVKKDDNSKCSIQRIALS